MSSVQVRMQNAFTGILVICAILVTGVMVWNEFVGHQNRNNEQQHVADWAQLLVGRHPDMGQSSALLNIVEFSDYQCPFCRDLEPKLRALVDRYPDKVAVFRYELPIEVIHPQARTAAIAVECAKLQGIYDPFQAKVFEANSHLENLDWLAVARNAGVSDLPRFESCLSRNETARQVDADAAVAARLGIKSTPVMLINGNMVSGTQTQADLDKIAARALRGH